jgi:hypothetical protein
MLMILTQEQAKDILERHPGSLKGPYRNPENKNDHIIQAIKWAEEMSGSTGGGEVYIAYYPWLEKLAH